jgi:hypothetical protein
VVQGRVGIRGRRVKRSGHTVLFGRVIDLPSWTHSLDAGLAETGVWRYEGQQKNGVPFAKGRDLEAQFIPLTLTRTGRTSPIGDATEVQNGDQVSACYLTEQKSRIDELLEGVGWKAVEA